ncbi:helix-turn-helix domain-containing protein [Spirillospora sp. CA-255316]
MDRTDPAPGATLADRLNHLFATIVPPARGPYTNQEVAAGIRDAGTDISAQYLSLLRRGERDNPTLKHLEALARFFGVPPAYFFDEETTRRVDEELTALAALRDIGVRGVALRAAGLSPTGLEAVHTIIEQVRRLEGLAPPPDDDTPGGSRP